jgi:hypothetical protein
MTVMMAMPVVKAKANTIATNIFFISEDYRSDIMQNIRMLFLRENTYHSANSFHAVAPNRSPGVQRALRSEVYRKAFARIVMQMPSAIASTGTAIM